MVVKPLTLAAWGREEKDERGDERGVDERGMREREMTERRMTVGGRG
jgi:hypothetical protein